MISKLIYKGILIVCIINLTSCRKGEKFDGVNGFKTTHYPGGKLKTKVEFKDGLMNGKTFSYYKNGKLESEITYKNHLKHGILKSFYEDGKKESVLFFKNNKKDSICTYYYPNGETKKIENVKEGRNHGQVISYYPKGQISSSLNYLDGKKEGIQKYYYENGQLKAITEFLDGRPSVHLEEYSDAGRPINHGFKIVMKEVNRLAFDNTYIYQFKLNKEVKDVAFFMGDLDKGKFFPISYYTLDEKNGLFIKDFFVPPRAFLMDDITIIARLKTQFGNDLILTKQVKIAINNY